MERNLYVKFKIISDNKYLNQFLCNYNVAHNNQIFLSKMPITIFKNSCCHSDEETFYYRTFQLSCYIYHMLKAPCLIGSRCFFEILGYKLD